MPWGMLKGDIRTRASDSFCQATSCQQPHLIAMLICGSCTPCKGHMPRELSKVAICSRHIALL